MSTLFGLARIGRDAELRTTGQGEHVINLSLAFSYGRKVEGKYPTQWVEGVLWGKQADALATYLLKGQQVVVTIEDTHIETYRKSDGVDSVKLTGRVVSIKFAGSAPGQQAAAPAPARPPAQQPAQRAAVKPASGFDDMDDDIPF